MTQLDMIESKLIEILKKHIGKDSAIDAGTIAGMLSVEDNDTHRRMRSVITNVLRKTELPIGATAKGYFIIKDADELVEYVDALSKRSEDIDDRKARVMLNYSKYYNVKPLQLPDEDE